MKKYEIGVTVNLPDGKEVELAFLNLSLEWIQRSIEEAYPTMTSFTMTAVPINKED